MPWHYCIYMNCDGEPCLADPNVPPVAPLAHASEEAAPAWVGDEDGPVEDAEYEIWDED